MRFSCSYFIWQPELKGEHKVLFSFLLQSIHCQGQKFNLKQMLPSAGNITEHPLVGIIKEKKLLPKSKCKRIDL